MRFEWDGDHQTRLFYWRVPGFCHVSRHFTMEPAENWQRIHDHSLDLGVSQSQSQSQSQIRPKKRRSRCDRGRSCSWNSGLWRSTWRTNCWRPGRLCGKTSGRRVGRGRLVVEKGGTYLGRGWQIPRRWWENHGKSTNGRGYPRNSCFKSRKLKGTPIFRPTEANRLGLSLLRVEGVDDGFDHLCGWDGW